MDGPAMPRIYIKPTPYRAFLNATVRGFSAFGRGIRSFNQKPSILLLFVFSQLCIVAFTWALSLGLRSYATWVIAGHAGGLSPGILPSLREDAVRVFLEADLPNLALPPDIEDSVAGLVLWARYFLTSVGHLAGLLFATLGAAATIIAVEAVGAGERLSFRQALREALPMLPPLLVMVILVDYTLQGLRTLFGTTLGTAFTSFGPSLADAFGGGTQGALSATAFITGTIQAATVGTAAFLLGRSLLGFPRRLLDEEVGGVARPLALLAGLIVLQGAANLLGSAWGPPVVFGTNVAFLGLLLLASTGRFPAGLEWSWKKTGWRKADSFLLFVSVVSLCVATLLAAPQVWTTVLAERGVHPVMAAFFYILVLGGICYWAGATRPLGVRLVAALLGVYAFSVTGSALLPEPGSFIPMLILTNAVPLAFFTVALTEFYVEVTEAEEREGETASERVR
ncbi:MAG: hypothetical protein QXO51_07120 [Halobacteria archaeon]